MALARPATAVDIGRLVALAQESVAAVQEARGGPLLAATTPAPTPVELETSIAATDQLVLAGELDGAVVGWARVRLEALSSGVSIGSLDALYVEPPAREVGVGEALLAAVVDWCRERGCVGVDAPALPGDRSTKNFFEGSRFRARLLVMHHDLREGSP